jgi:two-component system, OmpR family, sensor histidine kinase KdpD
MARGDLRVYLGAAPGVGKTYAMLAEARRRRARGTDVVIGLLESHGRRLTEQMADGLERVPRRHVDYRGCQLTEMDLDAVLARRPRVVLVDELAHTNAPGSPNAKRWQDVEELLAAGIDVIATLNIQHLESLADVVEHITGVRRGDTIPDEVVRRANQVELVDMTPEALRRRMIHGNVYPPDRVEVALTHYFRPGNLTALRELALLWVADRVEEGLQRYRAEHDINTSWDTRERIMVALTGEPEGEALLRRAARIAARTPGSDLLAVHVVRDDGLAVAEPGSLAAQRALVESLGGSYHRLLGDDVAQTLVEFASAESVTQIVLGASRRNQLLAVVVGDNVGPRVVRSCGQIDVHIVTHQSASPPPRPALPRLPHARGPARLAVATLAAAAALVAITAGLDVVRPQAGLYIALPLYLITIVAAAWLGGIPVALGTVVIASPLADFYFVPSRHTLVLADVGGVLALASFVATGLLVTVLLAVTAGVRGRAAHVSVEAAALAALAARAVRYPNDLPALLEQVRDTFRLRGVSLLERAARSDTARPAWFVLASAGEAPPERPGDADVDIPVDTNMVLTGRGRTLTATDRRVLASCATQIAATVREHRLTQRAEAATEHAADERTRGRLLQLACRDLDETVTTARRALGRESERGAGGDLSDVIACVDRVGQIVTTLRDLSRLRFAALEVFPRAVDLDEVFTAALDTLGPVRCRLDLDLPDDLPDVVADAAALTRILTNLITRALRRGPADVPPTLTATAGPDSVDVHVVDHGPHVEADDTTATPVGSLTLVLARELAEAMGATLRTSETPGGGLTTTIGLRPATTDRSERVEAREQL